MTTSYFDQVLPELVPNRDNIRLWIHALESGEYSQTRGCLHRAKEFVDPDEPDATVPGGFCCMGVLNEVAIKAGLPITKQLEEDSGYYRYKFSNCDSVVYPDETVWHWLGLSATGGGGPEVRDPIPGGYLTGFVRMNDQQGYDFKTIAKALRITYGIHD